MFADAEAATIKGDLANRTDIFVGNEHLRAAVGALHAVIPDLVWRSIVGKK